MDRIENDIDEIKKILVLLTSDIDLEEVFRNSTIYADKNYEINFIYDYAAALVEICNKKYHVIMIDYSNESDIDLKYIDEISATDSEIAIIIISSSDDEKKYRELLSRGVQDCILSNQVTPSVLNRCILYSIERKKIDRLVEIQNAFFQQLFEKSPQAIAILDNKDRVIQINWAFTKIFQYSADEVKGKIISDLIVPNRLKDEAANLSRETLKGELMYKESVRRRKDKWLVDVAILGYPITLQNQQIGIYAMYMDISDRKRVERALTKSEEKFRRFVEGSFDIIYELNNHGRITYVAPTIYHISGYKVEELLGKNFSEFVMTEDPKDKHLDILKNFLKGKNLVGFQCRFKKKNGDMVFAEINATPIWEGNKVMGSQGIIRDISKRKITEELLKKKSEEIEEANARLEAANRELESFSYSVSHDLRAPIRHIAGFVNLLHKNMGKSIDEKASRYFTLIEDSVENAGKLIDDILNLSRMSRSEIRLKNVNLSTLVNEVLSDMKPDFEDRNIKWHIGDLPEVYADPVLLRQVLWNLLSNAIKYTRLQPDTRIEIGCKNGIKAHSIFISDNGVGFDMKYADKLFGVFQRMHDAKTFEGTGIGLAIVRRIINRHGGETWAVSEPGKGSTFYFSLPMREHK